MTYVVGGGAAAPSTSPVSVRVTRSAFAARSAATAMSALPELFRSSTHAPSQVPGQSLSTASISVSSSRAPLGTPGTVTVVPLPPAFVVAPGDDPVVLVVDF